MDSQPHCDYCPHYAASALSVIAVDFLFLC